MKSRTKTILSGKYLEIELFPVTAHGHRHDRRRKLSRAEQRKQNEKHAVKKLVRLINANFEQGDTIITLQYRAELRHDLTYAAVLRDVQNYLRRVKNYRHRHHLPEIKYIYVIELAGLIMSKLDRDVAESLWHYADFVNSRSFQPTAQEGGAAFANYIAGKKGGKDVPEKYWRKWNSSKNLTQPTENTKDGTHTRREIARLARERVDDRRYWEQQYSGYRFVSAQPVFNEFNGWWYLYVQLYKIEPRTVRRPSAGMHTAAKSA